MQRAKERAACRLRVVGAAAMAVAGTLTASTVLAQPVPAPDLVLLPRASLQALQQTEPVSPLIQTPDAPKQVSIGRAALLSAILPGLGEYYSGHNTRALVSGTAEAAIWASYITFKVQEDVRLDRSLEYAVSYAGATPGLGEDYFQAVGQFERAEGPGMWNEYVRKRARDTGEIVGQEYTGDDAWAWPTIDRFIEYRELRKSSLSAGERASNMIAVAIVNRVISVASVVQAVRADHRRAEEALGLRVTPVFEPEGIAWRLEVGRRF